MDKQSSEAPGESRPAEAETSRQPVGKQDRWLTTPLAVVIAGAIIAAAIVLAKTPASTSVAAVANAGSAITANTLRPPSASDHIIGSPSAPIVIVEFADFQCPYCSLIYQSLKQIVASSNGKIAWVFRNFPLDSIHPQARPAAEAAECIAAELGNTAFWKYMDDDFSNQDKLGPAWYAEEAASLGANMQTFNACVANKTYDSRINTDEAEAVENGGQGTPFTIIVPKSGSPVAFSGALPYAEIYAIIQSVEAKSGVATSTP